MTPQDNPSFQDPKLSPTSEYKRTPKSIIPIKIHSEIPFVHDNAIRLWQLRVDISVQLLPVSSENSRIKGPIPLKDKSLPIIIFPFENNPKTQNG